MASLAKMENDNKISAQNKAQPQILHPALLLQPVMVLPWLQKSVFFANSGMKDYYPWLGAGLLLIPIMPSHRLLLKLYHPVNFSGYLSGVF
jgi:hypothetical protein